LTGSNSWTGGRSAGHGQLRDDRGVGVVAVTGGQQRHKQHLRGVRGQNEMLDGESEMVKALISCSAETRQASIL
jgi:hypothetical protein